MTALATRVARAGAIRASPTIAVVLSVIAGFALSRSSLYTVGAIAVCGVLLIATRDLALGVGILLFASLLQEAPSLGGREITGVKVIGAVIGVAWVARLAVNRDDSRALGGLSRRKARAVAAALAVWTLLSSAWAFDESVALSETLRLLQAILLLFIAYSAVATRRDVWTILSGLAAGGVATTVLGALQGYTAATAYNQWGEVIDRRFGGLAGDPNELAAQLVPALVICAIIAIAPGSRRVRVFAAGGAAVLIAGIAGAASRGALVGLAIALVLAPFLLRELRLRTLVAAAGIAALLIAAVAVLAPPELAHRLRVFSDGGTGRTDLWRVGLHILGNHPLAGAGPGNFPLLAPHYAGSVSVRRPDIVFTAPHVVHNTLLQFFVDTGVIGGALAVVVFVAAFRSALSAVRHSRGTSDSVLAQATLMGVTAYLGSLFFISGAHEKPLWVLLALSLRLPDVLAPVGAAQEARQSPHMGMSLRQGAA